MVSVNEKELSRMCLMSNVVSDVKPVNDDTWVRLMSKPIPPLAAN